MTVRRALLSVSDKTGIVECANILQKAGFQIVSTGGTLKELQKAKVEAVSAEDITEFPECFGGRVKTMHPKIMGGILFNRDLKEDREQAKKLGIEPIDVVVVNVYPFEETLKTIENGPSVAKAMEGKKWKMENDAALIEMIDIGGPTLLRSAAKNHASVTVVCDPKDYDRVSAQIVKNGDTTPELRAELAVKAFERTAAYDAAITKALSNGGKGAITLTNKQTLRYGENPHQRGAFYEFYGQPKPWKVLQEEKQISYLNILDADGAWNLTKEFSEPTAACIKHANPSGVASAADITDAFQKSYDTDKLSAFGVTIALNRPYTPGIIRKIIDQKIFVEILIAPSFEPKALELLKQKPKIRVLALTPSPSPERRGGLLYRSALGGMLVQDEDTQQITEKDLICVTKKKPTKEQIADLLFAWKVVKHAKSNAIVLVKDQVTVGIGCGQTSRVDASWIAAKRAGERAKGSVLASDAFFPFPDALEEAAKSGVAAVIQPGGSIRDAEVIAVADKLGIAMVMTGVRAFRH